MQPRSRINNVIAGLFLLGALIAGVAISVVLSGMSLRPTTDYTIRFPVSDGATGLQQGSSITLGGQAIGEVRNVRFHFEDGRAVAIDVAASIDSKLTLFSDAKAQLILPLLGTLSSVNFPSPGGETPGAQSLPPGSIIPGEIAPLAILAQAGFGPEEAELVRQTIRHVERVTAQFNTLLEEVVPEIDPVVADIRRTTAEARELAASLRARMDAWSERVDQSLSDINTVTAELPDALAEAREAVGEGRELMTTARATLDENRSRVREITDNVASMTRTARETTLPGANRAVEAVNERLDTVGGILSRTETFLAQELPTVRRTLANAMLASGQLKLAMSEIRAQPWRLLHRPSTRELREQLVYDSARAYADAVAQLRAASEALEGAIAIDGRLDEQALQSMRQRLEEAFADYERAERELLDRLIQQRQ